MAKVITYINEKGGVGKTSVCFNSAWNLAENGSHVLMIDMDGQKANLTFFTGIDQYDNLKTMVHVLKHDGDIKDTVLEVAANLDIVPATAEVSSIGMESKISKFRKALKELDNFYDYIFIDVSPTPNWSHYLSLSVSDYAVVIMLPDLASLEGNKGVFETVEEITETTNPNLKIAGILMNKAVSRTVLAKQVLEMAEEMAAESSTRVFNTKIRNAVVLSENLCNNEGVTSYAPKSPAADDIREFVAELEKVVQG